MSSLRSTVTRWEEGEGRDIDLTYSHDRFGEEAQTQKRKEPSRCASAGDRQAASNCPKVAALLERASQFSLRVEKPAREGYWEEGGWGVLVRVETMEVHS